MSQFLKDCLALLKVRGACAGAVGAGASGPGCGAALFMRVILAVYRWANKQATNVAICLHIPGMRTSASASALSVAAMTASPCGL